MCHWTHKLNMKVFTEVKIKSCFPLDFYKARGLCATTAGSSGGFHTESRCKALLHWFGFFSMEVTSMFYAVHGFAQYVLKKESGFINIRMIQES